MYFTSRSQAGKLLADELEPKYRYENCAVVALDDGGVMIGAEIAMRLHCVLTLLMTAPIDLPRENMTIAAINQTGNVTYNSLYSGDELADLASEFRNTIEEEKIQKFHELNRSIGRGDLIKESLVKGRNVILVSDGLDNNFSLDAAVDFLKPIRIEKIIVATPLATVGAVDRMHILADEIHCLDVPANYVTTDHYYEVNDLPKHDDVIKIIKNIVLSWR